MKKDIQARIRCWSLVERPNQTAYKEGPLSQFCIRGSSLEEAIDLLLGDQKKNWEYTIKGSVLYLIHKHVPIIESYDYEEKY